MKRLLLLFVTVCMLAPAIVNAQAQAKPYLGGSVGASFYDTSVEDVTGEDFKLEGEEFAWKIFGGVRWGSFALEGDYRHFGEIQNTVGSTDLSQKTTGWDLFAMGNLKIGPVMGFAKAGFLWWRGDVEVLDEPFEVTGSDFGWGLGAALLMGGLGVRAEFERFELDDGDTIMMLTAGVSFGM